MPLTLPNGTVSSGDAPTAGMDGGYGLAATRERLLLVDGDLTAGPTPQGWRVRSVVESTEMSQSIRPSASSAAWTRDSSIFQVPSADQRR
ncbi:hypothetical protein [Streptomyces sp. PA5.6]|uniref:hypothetical protein n=1 Tax=Streptomyces sp. PA5.6 TaxID=3035651 RepID=UPI003904A875